MDTKILLKTFALLCFLFVLIAWGLEAQADPKQIKLYKEAFPSAKLKCMDCHAVEKPKKEEGQHDLNAYGLKVLETSKEPTADTYKTVGAVEDFKADVPAQK